MLSTHSNTVSETQAFYVHRPGTPQERKLILSAEIQQNAKDLFILGSAIYAGESKYSPFRVISITPPLKKNEKNQLAIELYQDASKLTSGSFASFAKDAENYAVKIQQTLSPPVMDVKPENLLTPEIKAEIANIQAKSDLLSKKIDLIEEEKGDTSALMQEFEALKQALITVDVQLKFELVQGAPRSRQKAAGLRKIQWLYSHNADIYKEFGQVSEEIQTKVAKIKNEIFAQHESIYLLRLKLKITQQKSCITTDIDNNLVLAEQNLQRLVVYLKTKLAQYMLDEAHQQLCIANKKSSQIESKLKHLLPPRHKAVARILHEEVGLMTKREMKALHLEAKTNRNYSKLDRFNDLSSAWDASTQMASTLARKKFQLRLKKQAFGKNSLFNTSENSSHHSEKKLEERKVACIESSDIAPAKKI